MIGPIAMPPMKQASQTPIANARCFGSSNMLLISAKVEGATVAPAIPIRARAAISISGLTENAASSEATPNSAPPISSSRRRPIRSPSEPMVISSPAIMKP